MPGNSPEVADSITALAAISRPRMKRRRLRLTAAENKAIEQHVRALFSVGLTSHDHCPRRDRDVSHVAMAQMTRTSSAISTMAHTG